jgi:hypothetical protein
MMIKSSEEIIIYESPDGGKTVYARKSGEPPNSRTLHSIDPVWKKEQELNKHLFIYTHTRGHHRPPRDDGGLWTVGENTKQQTVDGWLLTDPVCVKTEANEQRRMVILYESDYYNMNPWKPGDGVWLRNKMFQTMIRFHDTCINVSGVMISVVMHRDNPRDFVDADKVRMYIHMCVDHHWYNHKTNKDEYSENNFKEVCEYKAHIILFYTHTLTHTKIDIHVCTRKISHRASTLPYISKRMYIPL